MTAPRHLIADLLSNLVQVDSNDQIRTQVEALLYARQRELARRTERGIHPVAAERLASDIERLTIAQRVLDIHGRIEQAEASPPAVPIDDSERRPRSRL